MCKMCFDQTHLHTLTSFFPSQPHVKATDSTWCCFFLHGRKTTYRPLDSILGAAFMKKIDSPSSAPLAVSVANSFSSRMGFMSPSVVPGWCFGCLSWSHTALLHAITASVSSYVHRNVASQYCSPRVTLPPLSLTFFLLCLPGCSLILEGWDII